MTRAFKPTQLVRICTVGTIQKKNLNVNNQRRLTILTRRRHARGHPTHVRRPHESPNAPRRDDDAVVVTHDVDRASDFSRIRTRRRLGRRRNARGQHQFRL